MWPERYYWLTLIFAAIDLVFGANVRAVGLADHPELRVGYYAVCLACAGIIHVRPGWGTPIVMMESAANVALLIFAVMLAYYDLAADVGRGVIRPELPFTPAFVINFAIAGGAATAAFYGSMLQQESGSRHQGPG